MEILDDRIIGTDLVINILSYLEIQIKGLRLWCCQEAVTSRGFNQEEQSSYCSSTAYTVDNAGKTVFLTFFQRCLFSLGAKAHVLCAWFSVPEPGTGANA